MPWLRTSHKITVPSSLPEASDLDDIVEPLLFDYCMNGHPGHSIPPFLAWRDDLEARSTQPASHKEIALRLSLDREIRFRTFSIRFTRDFTAEGWPEGATRITFVYCTTDKGQRVLTLADRV